MFSYNFLYLILGIAILSILTVGFIYLWLGLRAGLKEYVQLRSDFSSLLNADPQFYAKKLEPIIRELLPKMVQQGGSQKPLKITGNPGIDGLITMYLGSKMAQPSPGTSGAPTSPQGETKPLNNPFE